MYITHHALTFHFAVTFNYNFINYNYNQVGIIQISYYSLKCEIHVASYQSNKADLVLCVCMVN